METKGEGNKQGSCSVVISKPQTESSLIPRPSFHGSLCSTEYCIAGNFRWSKF